MQVEASTIKGQEANTKRTQCAHAYISNHMRLGSPVQEEAVLAVFPPEILVSLLPSVVAGDEGRAGQLLPLLQY